MTDFERQLLDNYREETYRFIEAVERQGKRNCIEKISLCIAIVMITLGFLWFLNQYNFSSTTETTTSTIEQSTDGFGDVNYIGQRGIISNGEAKSYYNNNEEYKVNY